MQSGMNVQNRDTKEASTVCAWVAALTWKAKLTDYWVVSTENEPEMNLLRCDTMCCWMKRTHACLSALSLLSSNEIRKNWSRRLVFLLNWWVSTALEKVCTEPAILKSTSLIFCLLISFRVESNNIWSGSQLSNQSRKSRGKKPWDELIYRHMLLCSVSAVCNCGPVIIGAA